MSMMRQTFELTYRMAGVTFRTESDSPHIWSLGSQGNSLTGRSFQRFVVNEGEPDVYHRFRGVDPDSMTLPPLDREESKWLSHHMVYSEDGLRSDLLRSPAVRTLLQGCRRYPKEIFVELHPFSVSVFDFARRELNVFYTPDFGKVVRSAPQLPAIFAPFLPLFSAAMLHAAALSRNGLAALFLSPDGGGKTTVIKQSSDGTVLCDDHIILHREGDAFIAHSTPWGLYTDGPKKAKLGGFFLLEQAERFELTALKPVHALEYLWNEHLAYRLPLPHKLRVRLFELLYDACHQVPVYRMRFPKDYVDWDAIDAAMER